MLHQIKERGKFLGNFKTAKFSIALAVSNGNIGNFMNSHDSLHISLKTSHRGRSRVRLVRQMTKSSSMNKIDTFYEM